MSRICGIQPGVGSYRTSISTLGKMRILFYSIGLKLKVKRFPIVQFKIKYLTHYEKNDLYEATPENSACKGGKPRRQINEYQ